METDHLQRLQRALVLLNWLVKLAQEIGDLELTMDLACAKTRFAKAISKESQRLRH